LSWCDKLASVPSIGFKLNWHFVGGNAILQALSPVLNRWVEGDRQKFTVDRLDAFGAIFTTEDGFQYGAEPSRLFVNFQHRLRAKFVSGGPPVMEMLSHPLPYTELLATASKRLLEAALLIPEARARKVERIGVVATTVVAMHEVPPGIARFLKYFARPWDGNLESFNIQLMADLKETAAWSERCQHTLAKPDDPKDDLLTIQFDWQRTFATGRAVAAESLPNLMAEAEKAAMDYFEDLAEGSRFDENLLRTAT
jgi:hypothetical protein